MCDMSKVEVDIGFDPLAPVYEEHDGSDKMRNISRAELDLAIDELDAIFDKLDKQADEI